MQRKRYLPVFVMLFLPIFLTGCGPQTVTVTEKTIVVEANPLSSIFDDPEIKTLIASSQTDKNHKPPLNLIQYMVQQGVTVVYDKHGIPQYASYRDVMEAISFFDFLDIVINKELSNQSYHYRKTVCKIILRYFLTLTPSLDSLYARQYTRLGTYRPGSIWDMAGSLTIADSRYNNEARLEPCLVFEFVRIKEGKITDFNFVVSYGACGGYWSSCCESLFEPESRDVEMAKDLLSIRVPPNGFSLSGMDLSSANLKGCSFGSETDFTEVNITDAVITQCDFFKSNVTLEQIKSTFNYKIDWMYGIRLPKELQDTLDAASKNEGKSP